jgi:2,4-dienoyl-CoA reductase [(3E)-enoyl-CoA-producing], peroxisomal
MFYQIDRPVVEAVTASASKTMDGPPSSSSSPFRPDCLQGRVCLVTGGGSGICFEITRQLIKAGCAGAIICGRREEFLKRAVQLLWEEAAATARSSPSSSSTSARSVCRVDYQVCDVRDPEQCEAVIEFVRRRYNGRLDILVNGAAGNFLARADQLSPKGFATVMAIDTLGTFHMCRAAHALLQETAATSPAHHAAHIINISATLQYGATWWQAHASAAKAAVDSLTRSLALEWGGHNIRVNGIAPGPIANTPGTAKLAPTTGNAAGGSGSLVDLIRRGIPLGRMGDAREIGEAAVYLCTATYVTGHVLVVDGGEWLYRPPLVPADRVADLSRSVESKSRALVPPQPRPKL